MGRQVGHKYQDQAPCVICPLTEASNFATFLIASSQISHTSPKVSTSITLQTKHWNSPRGNSDRSIPPFILIANTGTGESLSPKQRLMASQLPPHSGGKRYTASRNIPAGFSALPGPAPPSPCPSRSVTLYGTPPARSKMCHRASATTYTIAQATAP